jgi:hypothetical protein
MFLTTTAILRLSCTQRQTHRTLLPHIIAPQSQVDNSILFAGSSQVGHVVDFGNTIAGAAFVWNAAVVLVRLGNVSNAAI